MKEAALATHPDYAKLGTMLLPARFAKGLAISLLSVVTILTAWLPFSHPTVLQSPDETAILNESLQISQTGSAAMPADTLGGFAWLHPRSWTRQGSTLKPIGFLGWPTILAPFARVLPPNWLPLVATLLILSALIPLWKLFRPRYGFWPTWSGLLVLLTYPAITLYLNRSLFPNLIQLAGLAWTLWLVTRRSDKHLFTILSGLVFGLTLSIRPIEAVWLIPVVILFGWWMNVWTRQTVGRWLIAVLVGCLPATFVAWRTYGTLFQSGYLLRDWQEGSQVAMSSTSVIPEVKASWSITNLFPYGFHPRHIWWNVKVFFLQWLWPWWLALFVLLATQWKRCVDLKQKKVVVTLLAAACLILVLLSLYGSGLYTDHVQTGAVTLGNSFLRYLLPLEILPILLLIPYLSILGTTHKRRILLGLLIAALSGLGLWTSCFHDDESLVAIHAESQRYDEIRGAARQRLPPDTIILSDRSDKIFFPVFAVASPMPDLVEVKRLVDSSNSVAIFMRPPDEAFKKRLEAQSLKLEDRGAFGREHLYTVN